MNITGVIITNIGHVMEQVNITDEEIIASLQNAIRYFQIHRDTGDWSEDEQFQ